MQHFRLSQGLSSRCDLLWGHFVNIYPLLCATPQLSNRNCQKKRGKLPEQIGTERKPCIWEKGGRELCSVGWIIEFTSRFTFSNFFFAADFHARCRLLQATFPQQAPIQNISPFSAKRTPFSAFLFAPLSNNCQITRTRARNSLRVRKVDRSRKKKVAVAFLSRVSNQKIQLEIKPRFQTGTRQRCVDGVGRAAGTGLARAEPRKQWNSTRFWGVEKVAVFAFFLFLLCVWFVLHHGLLSCVSVRPPCPSKKKARSGGLSRRKVFRWLQQQPQHDDDGGGPLARPGS